MRPRVIKLGKNSMNDIELQKLQMDEAFNETKASFEQVVVSMLAITPDIDDFVQTIANTRVLLAAFTYTLMFPQDAGVGIQQVMQHLKDVVKERSKVFKDSVIASSNDDVIIH